MKGVVFTEYLEMVEDRFSPDMADEIIEECDLPSGGVYTAVGTYDHDEMIHLVARLAAKTGSSAPELVCGFGEYLFSRFHAVHPQFFQGIDSSFAFLQRIEDYIHVEVRKLYPEAELPSFECEMSEPGSLCLTYRSRRPFAALAEGLIRGCTKHFGEPVTIEVHDLSGGAGTKALFVLTREKDGDRGA